MIDFTVDEIKQQIRDCIQPNSEVASDFNMLLSSAFGNKTEEESVDIVGEVEVGTLGTWSGKLGKTEVGLVVDKDTLQLFKKKRYGLVPVDLAQSVSDWKLVERIDGYDYEVKNNVVYLVF